MEPTFEDFWNAYPHHSTRSKRAMSKAKWDAITGPGLDTVAKDGEGNSMRLNLKADPQRIYRAAVAYRLGMSDNDKQYAPGAQVWLNQGRFEDYDDAQLEDAVRRWERIQAILAKQQPKPQLRAVS